MLSVSSLTFSNRTWIVLIFIILGTRLPSVHPSFVRGSFMREWRLSRRSCHDSLCIHDQSNWVENSYLTDTVISHALKNLCGVLALAVDAFIIALSTLPAQLCSWCTILGLYEGDSWSGRSWDNDPDCNYCIAQPRPRASNNPWVTETEVIESMKKSNVSPKDVSSSSIMHPYFSQHSQDACAVTKKYVKPQHGCI